VVTHLARVVGEVPGPDDVVLRFARVEIGSERRLRVDHDLLAARDSNHEIGSQQRSLRVASGGLLLEVAVRDHPCGFDNVAELDFAPAAAYVRCA
jgi:hypothetical protein